MKHETQLLYLLLALSAGHTAPTPPPNKTVQLPAQPNKTHCRETKNAVASRVCLPPKRT